jgi:hypothetical protein
MKVYFSGIRIESALHCLQCMNLQTNHNYPLRQAYATRGPTTIIHNFFLYPGPVSYSYSYTLIYIS